jgi:ketosteroid isomerase-like protein
MEGTVMSVTGAEREHALQEATVRFGEAWASGNMAVLNELLSPTYTHHDAYGERLNRQSWLDYASRRTGRDTRIEFRGVETRIFGDVAVVTGTNIITGDGVRSAKDTKDLEMVFTQVWVWRDGRWLREAFQATPVIESRFG